MICQVKSDRCLWCCYVIGGRSEDCSMVGLAETVEVWCMAADSRHPCFWNVDSSVSV